MVGQNKLGGMERWLVGLGDEGESMFLHGESRGERGVERERERNRVKMWIHPLHHPILKKEKYIYE